MIQPIKEIGEITRAKGRFYAAASHELRTPLQGLSALLEFGLAHPRQASEWERLAADAHGQSRQLIDLTNDLLALNQLEMSDALPQLGAVDAGDLIERMLALRAPLIEQRQLQVQVSLPEGAELLAPWNHLDMLLRNLLDNAIKYATPGTELRVAWQPRQFSVWNAATLPMQTDMEHWFEPFFRDESAVQSAVDGNGLGLAICRAICQANSWKLSLDQREQGVMAKVLF